MEIVKFEQTVSKEIRAALTNFQAVEPAIEATIKGLTSIPEKFETKEDRDRAWKAASEAQKVIKEYGNARLELTRPIDDFKKAIMVYEKDKVADLESTLNRIKSAIRAFDDEQEVIRQRELARIEAERRAREEAERRERERQEAIRSKISEYESRGMREISNSSLASLRTYLVPSVNEDEFQEFTSVAIEAQQRLINERKIRLEFLEAQAKLEEEKRKAEEANAAEAAKLAEMQRKQAEERAKLEAEQRRLEEEKRRAAEESRRLEEESRRRAAEIAAREAEAARIKELEKQRLKGISQGIDSWEITDLHKVPSHLLRIELNIPEVKKYLKENDSVPGLKIEFKTKLILNG